MPTKAQIALEALEAVAKEGRKAWEELAEGIASSAESEEIQLFLQEIVEGEI